MAAKVLLALFVLLSVGFAGCSGGKSGPTEASPSASVAVTGDIVPDAASLIVTVLSEEQLPLAGVGVGIVELNVQAVTDQLGSARIGNIVPGTYVLAVQRLGYQDQLRKVLLGPNEEKEERFVLIATAVEEAFHRTLGPYRQFMACRISYTNFVLYTTSESCNYGAAGVYPFEAMSAKTNNSIAFKLEAENLDAVVGETKWQSAAYGTANRLMTTFSFEGRTSTHWWCGAAGTSPIRFVYSVDEDYESCASKGQAKDPAQPTKKHNLLMFSGVAFVSTTRPVDISIGQALDSVITIFYGKQPEENYSGFPDS